MPQKIPIYMYSVALTYNGNFIVIFLKAPYLEYIFRGTSSTNSYATLLGGPSPF